MDPSNQVCVALIDSGIGGFSVLGPIESLCPKISLCYFMDNLFLPYGELDKGLLAERLVRIVDFILRVKPDVIVIACNTASTQSLDYLRATFSVPFVGVVPAIKPAARLTVNGIIGLLATPATVACDYTNELIERFAAGCEVKRLGSSQLVHMAEQLFWQQSLPKQGICLAALQGVDTLVLGCTHFPLIGSQLQAMLPAGVKLVDSGAAVANRVASMVTARACDLILKRKTLYTSRALDAQQHHKLTQMGFDAIKLALL